MEYNHVQWGFFSALTFVLFAVVVVPIMVIDDETTTSFSVAMAALMVAILGLVIVFSRLEVTVSDGRVVTAFGFGRPRKVIELVEMTSVAQVRNSWVQGWGVRRVPGGWMYSVWGLDAVDLNLSSGEVFRIGTDDPENLVAVLSLHVPRNAS